MKMMSSEMDAETEKWQGADENNDIVKRYLAYYSLDQISFIYSLYLISFIVLFHISLKCLILFTSNAYFN